MGDHDLSETFPLQFAKQLEGFMVFRITHVRKGLIEHEHLRGMDHASGQRDSSGRPLDYWYAPHVKMNQ
jgi:hypothetical protein